MNKLERRNIEDIFALTPMQEGMLFHYLKERESGVYFEQLSLGLVGDIDIEMFERAWDIVIRGNEMLRTAFRWENVENPIQVVLNEHPLHPVYYDFSGKDTHDPGKSLEEIKTRDRNEKFDLRRVPFRVTLCRTGKEKYELIVSNHHILYDGWSTGIILREFVRAYHDLSEKSKSGEVIEVKPPVKTKYKEFVKWIQQQENQDRYKQEEYWKGYLNDFDSQTGIFIKKHKENRGKKEIQGAGSYRVRFDKNITEKLKDFVNKNKITLAAVMYTCWGILLQNYNYCDDVIFGTTVSGRTAKIKDIENIVGLFINTLPLRVNTRPGETIIHLLHRIDDVLQKRETVECTPLVKIKEYSNLDTREELFDSLVVIENYPLEGIASRENRHLSVESYSIFERTNYDLTVGITVTNVGDMAIHFSYPGELFAGESIIRLSNHFTGIIKENILEKPGNRVEEISIITGEETGEILYDFNNTGRDYPKDSTIHRLFEEQAERTPDGAALVGAHELHELHEGEKGRKSQVHVTYSQLNQKSNRLAHRLKARGVAADSIVGIMVHRSIEMIIGILGILKAGGAYLPINPGNPRDRVRYLLADSNAGILVSEVSEVSKVSEGTEIVSLSGLSEEFPTRPTHPTHLTHLTHPAHLCYIIYTSGSTGQPRGAAVTHSNFSPLIHWGYRHLGIDARDRVIQNLSYYFDWSVWEIFIALTTGAGLYLVTDDILLDPEAQVEFICKHGVTVLHITPSQYRNLVDTGQKPGTLKYLFIGAEKLTADLVRRSIRSVNKDCRIFNMYGPTEATIISSVLEIDRAGFEEYNELAGVPIGRTVGNTVLLILNPHRKLCPIYAAGELYIAGDGVAKGYINNPELTAERFDQDLWDYQDYHDENQKLLRGVQGGSFLEKSPPGRRRLYKTGDLVRWLADGNIEFLGRIDCQVKLRGFRIELGEIENRLLTHGKIKEAAVAAHRDKEGNNYLCAYYIPEPHLSFPLKGPELKEYLTGTLPGYMIPPYFVRLEKMPLAPGGKLNRKALPVPQFKEVGVYIPPAGAVEEKLVGIWSEVLGIDKTIIGIDTDFFEAGGHSLKATRVVYKVNKALEVNIRLAEFINRPTVRQLAGLIRHSQAKTYKEITPAAEMAYYPLSYAQRRLWIICQFEEDSRAYNIVGALTVSGKFNPAVFERALQTLVQRHESLRTVFITVNGEPKQEIIKDLDYKLDREDLRTLPGMEKLQKKEEIFRTAANKVFDLEKGPLFLFKLLHLEEERYFFIFNTHHLVNDGWSAGIINNEVLTLYNAFLKKEPDPLPPLKLQYKDYTLWHNALIDSGGVDAFGPYWFDKFKDKPNGIELPLDHPRKPIQTFNGGRVYFTIPRGQLSELYRMGHEEHVTLFMSLLALVTVFLYRWTGQTDIITASPIAGRRKEELQLMVGFLVNTLVYRCHVNPGHTFKEFLPEIKKEILESYENQDYPFDLLVEKLESDRDLSRSPIFNVMLAFNNTDIRDYKMSMTGVTLTHHFHLDEYTPSVFDLVFFMDERFDEIFAEIMYNRDLFNRGTVERMKDNFLELVKNVLDNRNEAIHALKYITGEQYEKIIVEFNNNQRFFPPLTVRELFENRVETSADKTAVVYNDRAITYRELNTRANRLAHHLVKEHHAGPNEIVGIYLDRSIEMVVAILGVIKSGAGYVAVDPNYPEERVLHMLADSKAKLIIIDKVRPGLSGYAPAEIIDIYRDWERVSRRPGRNPGVANSGADILYVIYTSGSTGTPNGAMLSQGILSNLVQWQEKETAIDGSLRCLQFTSINFCVSFQEIMTTLTSGGQLYLIGDIERRDIGCLMDFLSRRGIENLYLPFSYLNFLFNESGRSGRWENFKHSLGHIITAGEQLKITAGLKHFLERNPGVRLHNHYGSSEMHVVTSYTLDAPSVAKRPVPPAGKPIANTKIYILDDHYHPVPIGVWGELFIAGSYEVPGYIHNPGLTGEKLFLHPRLSSGGKRLYRSGDIGRWLPDGNIELRGRKDTLIKVRGFRIEPGEIESKILSIDRVKDCVVVVREDDKKEKYLLAYVVVDQIEVQEIKDMIGNYLPAYMIPGFMVLEHLPLMPGGKVDREQLPEPAAAVSDTPAGDDVEDALAGIWSGLLGIEKETLSVEDNFFELGGHSLKAATMIAGIHRRFNVEIKLADIFTKPTIKAVARYIKRYIKGKAEVDRGTVTPVEEQEYYPLSSAQKRLYVVQQIEAHTINYNMFEAFALEGEADKEKFEHTFRQLIHRHESLRTSFITVEEVPVQRIHEENYKFQITNSKQIPNSKLQIPGILKNFVRPFDLAKAPLLRVGLLKIEAKKHILTVEMNHIISDGTSIGIFIKDFTALYRGERLPALIVQYKDYARWQNSRRRREALKSQEEYWINQYRDEIPEPGMPLDFPRPPIQGFEGDVVPFEIDVGITNSLKRLALEENATLYMVLLAIYTLFLAGLTRREDIVVGTPTAGRKYAVLQDIIGMFVNTLAIRVFPVKTRTFKEFLKDVRERTLQAFENQDYQFEELVDRLAVQRDSARNPIFDLLFAFQNMEIPGAEIPGLKLTSLDYEMHISAFDMYLMGEEKHGKLLFKFTYCTALFKEEKIKRFAGYFNEIAVRVIGNKEITLGDVKIFHDSSERNRILYEFNNTARDYAGSGDYPVQGLFQQQVERTPDRTALVFKDHQITYRVLNQKANQLAYFLRAMGVKPDTIAAIMVEPCLEMITGILGILKAGGAYLPIDPVYPESRKLQILNDGSVSLLLTKGNALNTIAVTSFKQLDAGDVEPVFTGPREQVKDFDRLPLPDRTLVNSETYHRFIGIAMGKRTVSLQTSRGCPFQCAYCHKLWPKTHVTRSAENIFAEISRCFDAGIRRFVFLDDIFNLERKNSTRLLEMIIKRDMGLQLFFPNGMRGDILTKEFIDLMVSAGTVNTSLALESVSPRIQRLIRKNLNLEKFRESVAYFTQKYPQVILEMGLMLGFPTETEEETRQTLDFLKEYRWIHFPNVHILKIYPNTDMYRIALENGISRAAIHSSVNLAYHELPETLPYSKAFVRREQTRFMNEYILSKERLLHVLPQQMKTLSEEELIQKYDSYLPASIKRLDDILKLAGIPGRELGNPVLLKDADMEVPGYREKISVFSPRAEKAADAMRILFLDLSQFFTRDSRGMLYDMVEEPLGLMYLLTYLNEKFPQHVEGKIAKSRIDFDSYKELYALITGFKPDLIGIRSLSFYKEFFHRTISLIRQWGIDVPIISGGPYATSDYIAMLRDPNIDLAVLGEGELIIEELVGKMIRSGKKLPDQEILKEIKGIAYLSRKDKNRLKETNREIVFLDNTAEAPAGLPMDNPPQVNRTGDLLYLISTSGSTGIPRGVMLEHRNLVNLLNFQFLETGIDYSTDILQFSSIGFDVSAQEIFSALLSGGKLWLMDRDLKGDVSGLLDFIRRNKIGIVFWPPAYLKLIFSEPGYAEMFPGSVRHIIAAGEQLYVPPLLKKHLTGNRVYLTNNYGPSETHVVTTLTLEPGVEIPARPPIGKPITNTAIYILDEEKNLQPIGVIGELYIAGANVGRGYSNRDDLTAERYIPDPFITGGRMYRTGDLGRRLPDGNIEFIGRNDRQVQIRGFRVELAEIENRLKESEYIKEALVIERMGKGARNYLCGYIVSETTADLSGLRAVLSKSLPDYMIPSYFVQIEKIPLTPNGKVDRRALPDPEAALAGKPRTAPGNEIEEKLIHLWADVLEIDSSNIGVTDNFFELGGHSLKATILVTRVHKVLDVKITLGEMFRRPTIRQLAEFIKETVQERYSAIQPAEVREYYPVPYNQSRLFFLQQMEPGSPAFHMPGYLDFQDEVEPGAIKWVLDRLIRRHESFRTAFTVVDDHPCQVVLKNVEIPFAFIDVSAMGREFAEKEQACDRVYRRVARRPFDLSTAPLFRAALVKLAPSHYRFMFNVHHIVSDGWSTEILKKEFDRLYEARRLGREIELPVLSIQYKDFALRQNRQIQGLEGKNSLQFWRKKIEDGLPGLQLRKNSRETGDNLDSAGYSFALHRDVEEKLKKIAVDNNTGIFTLLYGVFVIVLSRFCGQEDVVTGILGAGRNHDSLQHIMGFFVNTLVMKNHVGADEPFPVFLGRVHRDLMEIVQHQDYPLESVFENLNIKFPHISLLFNMFNLDQWTSEQELAAVEFGPHHIEKVQDAKFEIAMFAADYRNGIRVYCHYRKAVYKKERIEYMMRKYMDVLKAVAAGPGKPVREYLFNKKKKKRNVRPVQREE
jgi:amino acid adenylation domain-containing protein